jgi:hypothetical protein
MRTTTRGAETTFHVAHALVVGPGNDIGAHDDRFNGRWARVGPHPPCLSRLVLLLAVVLLSFLHTARSQNNCVPGWYVWYGCNPCPAGTWSYGGNNLGEEMCFSCASGTFSSAGSGSCTQCSTGSYSGTRATQCTPCGKGTYCPSRGCPSCLPCGGGTYADVTGRVQCVDCPAGTFSRALGGASVSSCLPCAPNFFSDTAGSTSCLPCAAGMTSGAGATACNASTLDPSPQTCDVFPFPRHDVVGTVFSLISVQSAGGCLSSCCNSSICAGFSFLSRPPGAPENCLLLTNITSVVPSNFASGGVRNALLGL